MGSAFHFDACVFVQRGFESEDGEWSERHRASIAELRKHYPELGHWGDLALGCAFGEWSQDFFLVGWADWMLETRDELFLNFCCWRQTRGQWKAGFDEATLEQAADWRKA